MLEVADLAQAPDGFLVNDPEDGDYHRAFQRAQVEGFSFGYLEVRQDARRVAVLPYFLMDFHLNTMLPEGALKRMLGFLKFRVACVGHPSTDLGHIDGEPSAEVLAAANRVLAPKAAMVAYKGFGPDLPLPGFVSVRGLPVALLRIEGDYWSQLSSERRSNLKRKLKKSTPLVVKEQSTVDAELARQLHALYLQTYERAEVKFEILPVAYFSEMAGISKYLLFYEGDRLIGFVQLICKKPRMVFRYLGMDYSRSQEYGLYFALFLRAIELCVRDGYTELESGATTYDFKRKIGSDILETTVYYRHRNPLVHWVLGRIKFLLEPSEAELQ